jgi:hypothetical protein
MRDNRIFDRDLAPLTVPAQIEAILDEVVDNHGVAEASVGLARKQYEQRRGNVHQDEELWETWSAAFVEWFVLEYEFDAATQNADVVAKGLMRAAAQSWHSVGELRAATIALALANSHRSLFEVMAMRDGRVDLVDLLGGAAFSVVEARTLVGVDVGDVAELRLVGVDGLVYFGKTFVYHPKAARDDIVAHAQRVLAQRATRLDAVDAIAVLRAYVPRYRHLAPARVYQMGSKLSY